MMEICVSNAKEYVRYENWKCGRLVEMVLT